MVNAGGGEEPTALVIEHTIKKGSERRYKNWLAEILEATKNTPGYLGREVFPPREGDKPYVIIVRFQTGGDLQNWLDSPERKTFIRQIQETLSGGDKTSVKAGIDVWFMPDDAPNKPPAYKQFLLTIAAIYPLTLVMPHLLAPLFDAVPFFKNPFVGGLIGNVIVVGLMTYLIMPRLTHSLRDWLFKPAGNKK